jgi:hypothetical protein
MQKPTNKPAKRTLKLAAPAIVAPATDTAPVALATAPVAAPVAKPVHGERGTYNGPSPSFRQHGRKLTPVTLSGHIAADSLTARMQSTLSDLYRLYGNKPFSRFDIDAGILTNLVSHACVAYISGGTTVTHNGNPAVTGRDAQFRVIRTAPGGPAL